MKEKPTENRKFTGNDKSMSAEQVGNLLKSSEFDIAQKQNIKDILNNTVAPQIEGARRNIQMLKAMELIRPQKEGDLMIIILKCRYAGYSHEKIAKTLMKSERDLPHFSSVEKAAKFVKDKEHEGLYKVKVALSKKSRIIIP